MSYRLNVRWGPRPETVTDCAQRFARMLVKIATLHPDLADWRQQACTKAAAYKPFCTMPPQVDELEAILQRGRHFKSASGELSLQLGYSVAAWNGLDEPRGLSLSLDVGAYTDSRIYPNEVELCGIRQANISLVHPMVLKSLLLRLAACWQADWGVVETWAYKGWKRNADGSVLFPYGGWLTYLSAELANRIIPPAGVNAEQLSDGSLFMSVSDEPFDVANPVHVARLDAVQQALAPVQE